ncbi:N-acetylmuramoyl-L-alanine amidase [Archangium sp.]|uniref:N-acetylmuramoyl-L-alanine amidase n=1 Tax=Archangium sp. TaxID=1872627 RepID=UPI002D2EDE0B|nr:N-acetylmuramoyl-L-alanine amidase [Archangium sp.]HYO59122.1 N-acetylmuramoyl-L-alanine amidase [Archangium sp.]
MLVAGSALAQVDPQRNLERIVAERSAFPSGTRVLSVRMQDERVVVELSSEAVAQGLGDEQADEMVRELLAGLDFFPGIREVEVLVDGKPLWKYLPASSEPPAAEARSLAPARTPADALSLELQGKKIALHPSHGSYWNNTTRRWVRAQRTFTGPNPATRIPSGWTGGNYSPSDEYFWNRGFQWGSIYEDDITIHVMRFVKEYLESSGAQVFLTRELSDDAGLYDHNRFGYPNVAFPLPKKQVASKYYLEEHGAPRWVWDEPSLSDHRDKDIRARPYYANYVGADLSISLHTNAFPEGGARGTETFWYTAKYPHLEASAKRFAAALNEGAVKSIREYFDDSYGRQAYVNPYPASGVPEWPYYSPHPTPFEYGGYNRWNDRGVKTSNFGEIREAQMPAALIELAFHDSWKWYPDNLFLQDPIFQATSAWGMYEGVCRYFGITPKPRLASKLVEGTVPALVGPNQVLSASVTFQNEGMTWNWGRRHVNGVYAPYTVWQLRVLEGQAELSAPERISIGETDILHPGDSKTFDVPLVSPAVSGLYPLRLRMTKADARGGDFGEEFAALVRVDADPPAVSVLSPQPEAHPYGTQRIEFSAEDAWSGVAELTATLDGVPVTSGEEVAGLMPGEHTLVVSARDGLGNATTFTRTFTVVNSSGRVMGGGWARLARKKATFGVEVLMAPGTSQPVGHFTFHDHDLELTLHSEQLRALGLSRGTATVSGTCTVNHEPGHGFRLELTEGSTGKGGSIRLVLDTGYHFEAPLDGGNVTLLSLEGAYSGSR